MKESLLALLHSYPLLVVLGAVLLGLEAWAWYRMFAGYFTQGLPVFRSDIAARPPSQDVVQWLGDVQPKGFWGEFRFKALNGKRIALREFTDWKKPWRPTYLPMMRAVLEVDAARGRLRMTAYLNYWLFVLLLPALLLSLQKAATLLQAATTIFGYALLVVGIYIIQLIRYQGLVEALEKQGQASKPEPRRFSGL